MVSAPESRNAVTIPAIVIIIPPPSETELTLLFHGIVEGVAALFFPNEGPTMCGRTATRTIHI
jgi:hypothetical protein